MGPQPLCIGKRWVQHPVAVSDFCQLTFSTVKLRLLPRKGGREEGRKEGKRQKKKVGLGREREKEKGRKKKREKENEHKSPWVTFVFIPTQS